MPSPSASPNNSSRTAITITGAEYTELAAQVEAAFVERLTSCSQELAELTENRKRLQDESDKLLATHLADAIDLDTLKRHQDRIRTGLADIDRRLANEHEGPRKQLGAALGILIDCQILYARTDDHGNRFANQALTNGIEISEDEQATTRLAEPFAALTFAPGTSDVRSSSKSEIVELGGFEPPTSSMPWKRATNCAIAPGLGDPRGPDTGYRMLGPCVKSGPSRPTLCAVSRQAGIEPGFSRNTDQ